MYPGHWLSLYPAFPRGNRVFVAMDFGSEHESRWKRVIEPALTDATAGGARLQPYRVDARRAGDSIFTEIVEGIAQSRLVVADITTLVRINERPVRNGNVMYELGIAQAIRLPEEVLIFRSDSDPLPFDTFGFRTHSYDPDGNPAEAAAVVGSRARDALKEIDLRRSTVTERMADRLGSDDFAILVACIKGFKFVKPENAFKEIWNLKNRASLQRLLDLA
jgi:hypothetical protein